MGKCVVSTTSAVEAPGVWWLWSLDNCTNVNNIFICFNGLLVRRVCASQELAVDTVEVIF